MNIPLARPDISDLERRYVMEVLETPNLSLGPWLGEFERRLAVYAGVRHAVAVNSGTSALHLVVRGLGIRDNEEVVTTPFSFIASANCIVFERAKPVFVDIDPLTLNIDAELAEQAIMPRTRAILAVDVFGHPANWDRLSELAKKYSLKLIEDAAEAVGSEYRGRKCGSFGDAAIFAFYPNKQMTTGEGGAVLTDNEDLARLCRSMRNQGRSENGEWLQHCRLGYNYRLSDINCALGLAQLERLGEMLRQRARVASLYNERLQSLQSVTLPHVAADVKVAHFVYVIRLSEGYTARHRDKVIFELRKRGIGCSDYFSPIHLQPLYRTMGYQPGDFPVTESISERTIALPYHNHLTEAEVDYVVEQLKGVL